jgi:hypothetical protein
MAAAAVAGRCGRSEVNDDFVQRPEVQAFFPKIAVKVIDARSASEPAH